MGQEARILIVCTGNICRSPFIERLLQRRLDERRPGLERAIQVRSAGTSALAGWAMDERAASQLVAYGGDPGGFSARKLTPDLIARSDLVLTATRLHRGSVSALYPKALRRVFALSDFADLVTGVDGLNAHIANTDPREWVAAVSEAAATNRGLKPPLEPAQADIVDPFGRRDAVFAAMAQQVVAAMPSVVRALAG